MDRTQTVEIYNQEVAVKEYGGKRVVTFKDIDTVHQRPIGTANKRFLDNRDKFIAGVDFFKISYSEIRKNKIMQISGSTRRDVTFVTESGYLMLVKSFTDDLAWRVQRELVNSYFGKTPEVQNVYPEQSDPGFDFYLKAAEIIAGLSVNDQYVINCLRHVIPDIDVNCSQKQNENEDINTKIEKSQPKFWKPGVNIDRRLLRSVMVKRALSKAKLAQMVGVSALTIDNWLTGKTRPEQKNFHNLCRVLGKDLNYFTLNKIA
jgi:Predicted transcriptional regulators